MENLRRPEGIEHKHVHEASGSRFRRSPFGLGGLALLLAPAFFGVYGSNTQLAESGGGVQLEVEGPGRARNGEFFELVLRIAAQKDVRDAVVLIGADLVQDVTVNTLWPDPSEQGFRDGSYELHLGALAAGDNLQVKLDGQINPGHAPTANKGRIAVADGNAVLVELFYVMEVLP